ncbi:MAG: HIT family protein [Lachnospiraceae bacterium]|nr:HIT family protein [Lachnospiraceae bacterium]
MKDDNCIFCKIANGEIPSATVYEDERFRAILDMGPASKGHTLILPKEHFKDVCELDEEYASKVLQLGGKIGAAMKKSLGCTGFNLVQNNGTSAGQTVFHFHMHVIPRYDNGAPIVTWEPGSPDSEELKETAERIHAEL